MSQVLPRSGSPPPSRGNDLLSFAGQAVRFGAEAYGQWWTITGRSLEREVERLIQGAKASRRRRLYFEAWPTATSTG